MSCQPLDLEDLKEKMIKKYWNEQVYDKEKQMKRDYTIEEIIKMFAEEIKQRIKSACKFYLEWCNNPKTFVMWYEDKEKVNELLELLENEFSEYWQDKYDNIEYDRTQIILFFNKWLFKLAFKEVFKEADEK